MAFNGRFVVNIAHQASNYGVDASSLIALVGKSEDELCEESCIIDDRSYSAIIEKAVESTKDPFFGLHAGENLNIAAAGLIAQITQSCETIKQALDYCCEFANLGCSALPMSLNEEGDSYKVTLNPDLNWSETFPIAFQHTTDGVLAFTIKEFQSLTRQRHQAIAVYLPWEKPNDTKEYERVFDCPVYYNKEEIAILLRKEDVEDKIISSDYELLRILVAHAEEKSLSIESQKGFVSLVRQSVVKLIKPEFPSIEMVAGHLNLSKRTLQRRLNEEGFTYKGLIEELKKDFAIRYLKRPDLSISEIAYLLNYADLSSFTRSFKRWTHTSPKEYRLKTFA